MPRLALLGDPVAHSRSPRFQNAALAALNLDGTYEAIRCPADDLPGRLSSLAELGYAGLNLTVPLKERAFALLQGEAAGVSAAAAALRAVNTLRLEAGGRWSLHNTDPEGFRLAAQAVLPGGLAGRKVLLLGAGGAARAVALACLAAGCARVGVWNRSPERLGALLADLSPSRGEARLDPVELQAGNCPAGFDLIVQASSLGLNPDDLLPPLPLAGEGLAAMDLVTHATPWQRRCAELGAAVSDGREMLLGQGAAAFRIWTGLPAPLAAMRTALEPAPD